MSHFTAEFYEYCADCSDRTDAALTFPKVWAFPAKLLAMQRARALGCPDPIKKVVVDHMVFTTFARR